MFEFVEMLPTEDPRSWAMRLAHYGIVAGLAGLVIAALLLVLIVYLAISVRSLRARLSLLENRSAVERA